MMHHAIALYIKINIYIYVCMYVSYSTEGPLALLDQAKLSLLVWVSCFLVFLFFVFLGFFSFSFFFFFLLV